MAALMCREFGGLACYSAPNCRKAIEDETYENDSIYVLSKSKEKSERKKFYPANARIYGKSNNVRKWMEEDMTELSLCSLRWNKEIGKTQGIWTIYQPEIDNLSIEKAESMWYDN